MKIVFNVIETRVRFDWLIKLNSKISISKRYHYVLYPKIFKRFRYNTIFIAYVLCVIEENANFYFTTTLNAFQAKF